MSRPSEWPTFRFQRWHIARVWSPRFAHIWHVRIVPRTIVFSVSRRGPGLCGRGMWQVVPKHADEAIGNLCAEATV